MRHVDPGVVNSLEFGGARIGQLHLIKAFPAWLNKVFCGDVFSNKEISRLQSVAFDVFIFKRIALLKHDYFFFNKFVYLFIYFWLCWVFVSVQGLSIVAASGGHSSSRCAGLSLSRPLLLRSTGSRRTGSVVVAHGPSCSVACGIFPDQGSNPCPLHWQADSQPLHHQGSPSMVIFNRCN